MDSLELTNLKSLMERTKGSPKITIGLIDGPINAKHPDLLHASIREIKGSVAGTCIDRESVACIHGTFTMGILAARRGSVAPAICPDCTFLIRPIFAEVLKSNDPMPAATAKELAQTIIESINAGARILNLSLAIAKSSSKGESELHEALDFAASQGAILVVAAGNDSAIGSTIITSHPWAIPVVAVNAQGMALQLSNLGNSIGKQGLSAPGENISSLGIEDKPFIFTGTSAATPFITGTIALLWSEFPHLSAGDIKYAITQSNNRRSMVPPLVDAWRTYQYLNSQFSRRV